MAEKHERYEWRGEEVRQSGPVDPNYDADKMQAGREAALEERPGQPGRPKERGK